MGLAFEDIQIHSAFTGEFARKTGRRLRILIWCNYDAKNAATMCDHVNAFLRFSQHNCFVYSGLGDFPDDIDFDEFDAVIIHYSLALAMDNYVSKESKWRLRRSSSLKLLFIQDEYRFVRDTITAIEYCGINVLFTCVKEADVPRVYEGLDLNSLEFHRVLTGYVPPWLNYYEPKPLSERSIDISYRGRNYPAWHGRAGREKIEIGKFFKRRARRFGLKVDIDWSEKGRLYGRAWLDLIRDSKAVLAVESGCSVFDFDGSISAKVESYARLKKKRGIIPAFDKEVEYEVLREKYFKGLEDQIDLSQISPRVFEAAALRSLLIMYRGEYSGVLKPWDHYFPLEKDHSNADEIVRKLKDDDLVSETISRTYAEVAINPSNQYERFIQRVDGIIENSAVKFGRFASALPKFEKPDDFHRHVGFLKIENPHAQGLPRSWRDRARVSVQKFKKLFAREQKDL